MDKLACKTMEILDSCIEDMNKKKDFTPADLEILCKAYKLRRELMCDEEMAADEEWDTSSAMYSRRNVMPRVYMDGSYRSMRSPVTGRYVSRDGGMTWTDRGTSGHSLKDRMIAKLETMYDEAQSEYERDELRKEIRRIEASDR